MTDLFKSYLVLYTCSSIRGVILELVPDSNSKYFFIILESLFHADVVQERYWQIMGQFLLRKKLKNLQQIEILDGHPVYLTDRGTEVFGSDLFYF